MGTKEIIELTKQLIAIPSTVENPGALHDAVRFVEQIVAKCPNVTIEHFEQNGKPSFLAYRGTQRPKTFDVLLNGHVDVVPAAPEQFKPYIKDGRLYGRGALDMKGTAIALTTAFCELVNKVSYDLALQIVCDEEVGGYDGVRLQLEDGVRSKFSIMGEYANHPHTIYNAARGLCWAEIRFKGKTSHGGHPWHGDNAVLKASTFAAEVLKRYPTPDKETWTTTANIASISTPNDTFNKVPDSAVLKIDFRFTQEDPVFTDKETLRDFIASIDPEAELIGVGVFEPAVDVEELNPYVQGLAAALQQVSGVEPKFLGRPAGSDGRHFALYNNDIVEFGIYGGLSHSDNEYAELASFDEYYQTIYSFLQKPILHTTKEIPEAQTAPEPLRQQLLRQLVAIPSTSGNVEETSKALNLIEGYLAARGMYIERFEKNGIGSLLASTRKGNMQPAVLLTAHVDVVPASQELFTMREQDGKLYGRGVTDMKFAIACYMELVDKLQERLDDYDFGILITSDEEVGGRAGGDIWVNHKMLRPLVAIAPDGGDNWDIETFAKGVEWIKLESTGKSAHSSRPWEGKSAIKPLVAALHEIEQLIPHTTNREATTLNVGIIEGGTAGNQIPHSASAMIDIRYGNMDDYENFSKQIHDICRRHDVTVTLLSKDAPCINDIRDPYIKSFRELVQAATGKRPDAAYSFGATDGRFFSAHGIPAIITTPESGDRHKDGEWLSVQGFEQFCAIVAQFVDRHASLITTQISREQSIKQLAKRFGKPADK